MSKIIPKTRQDPPLSPVPESKHAAKEEAELNKATPHQADSWSSSYRILKLSFKRERPPGSRLGTALVLCLARVLTGPFLSGEPELPSTGGVCEGLPAGSQRDPAHAPSAAGRGERAEAGGAFRPLSPRPRRGGEGGEREGGRPHPHNSPGARRRLFPFRHSC